MLALAVDDPAAARWALGEGEGLLDSQTLSHDHLQFQPGAIEVARGRALAAAAVDPGDSSARASLREGKRVAETVGLMDALVSIDRAPAGRSGTASS